MVAGKLRKVRSLAGHQRTFLQTRAPGPVKITLPSPSQFPAISFHMGLSDLFYPTRPIPLVRNCRGTLRG